MKMKMKMKKQTLSFIVVAISSITGFSKNNHHNPIQQNNQTEAKSKNASNSSLQSCKQHLDEKNKYTQIQYFCNSQGILKKSVESFLTTLTPSQIKFYDEMERIIHLKIFNIDNKQTGETAFQHNSDKSYIETKFQVSPLRDHTLSKKKKKMMGSQVNHMEDLPMEIWYYNMNPPYNLLFKDIIEQKKITNKFLVRGYRYKGIIKERFFYEQDENQNDKVTEIFKFNYVNDKFYERIRSFKIYNPDGSTKDSYSQEFDLDIEKLIDQQDLPKSERERRKQIYRNQNRPIVVIVESGIDVGHPDLTYKFFNNSYETPNGMDDDNNGIVDDTMGFYMNRDGNTSPIINERLVSTHLLRARPFSHGTHTSSIVMKGIEEFALAGFTGSLDHPTFFSKALDFFDKFDVTFINISAAFTNPYIAQRIEKLSKKHLETLIFVAAGNSQSGINLDESEIKIYPVGLTNKNVIAIGAINTNEIHWKDIKTYKRASFSNYGIKIVDLFAPGQDMTGALLGGGYVKASGTSMASPYAMNIAMQIKIANPTLSSLEIKEILMRSVTFIDIDHPLDCVSGGLINKDRALEIAKKMTSSVKSIEELNWEIRLSEAQGTYGEVHDEEYIRKIKALWAQRFFQ